MSCSLCGDAKGVVQVKGGVVCAQCLALCQAAASEQKAAWQTRHAAELAKVPPVETSSGLTIDPLYTAADTVPDAGMPGEPPFTRGVQATMYRGRPWTMRQYAGFGTAAQTNERFRYLLGNGQTGLSCAFDLPTQMGYDSDDPKVLGEVGRVGVAIDSREDMETLLQDIPLDKVSLSMTINAPAAILLAMVLVVAESRDVPLDQLSGTVQNDVLKEYVARGTYIFPLRQSLRLAGDIIEYCMDQVPRWNAISISGYHMREAGSTAAQEVAFALSNGLVYLEEVRSRGVSIDRFAPRLSFFFNAHNHLFEEVAKFRVARQLWAAELSRLGATEPRALALRFHTQTAGSSLTAQQPLNNVVRVTVQALAAVLGGTQSLHTNSFDEALALPTEASTLLALRTQQILASESGIRDTVDPLGGSWYVESLTARLEEKVRVYFADIERRGGMVACIEDGWVQREIHQAAYRYQQDLETLRQVQVGVNQYTSETNAPVAAFKLDPALEPAQVARIQAVRSRRAAEPVATALSRLEEAAAGRDNLMPFIVDAVRVHATVGEICGRLKARWGEYRPTTVW
ncbi:MAG TPA: methylmalonyl-CoA mutase family protein [Candidatus Xenobia bacterium]|jgi:methylmalonyl-CoA mutase N-terminal domain/subunit